VTISITTLSIMAFDTVVLNVANKPIRLSVIMLRVEAPFYDTQNNITQHNGTRPYIKNATTFSITALGTVMLSVATLVSVSLC
jgi:hypothetical protein